MLNIAVLVSGGGTNLQALLDSEARGENPNGKIRLVVASKPGVYALERAANAGVEGVVVRRKDYASSEDFDAALLKTLKEHNIDLVVLAGFLSVLGPSVIEAYPRRILNIHPALIPSFCGPGMYGLRPHEAALARGCKVTGATVHFVNEECDGGPILLQKAVDILPGDTPEVLQKRVMEQAEWKLLKLVHETCAPQEVHTRVDGQPELAALRHRRAADADELGVLGGDALKDGKGREGRELRRGVAVVGRDGDAFFKNALLHSCLRCAFSSVRGGSAAAAPRGGGDAARSPQRRPS